jgi:ABC-type dipeptide/oligopeptide/nickel transport system ATPase subunit
VPQEPSATLNPRQLLCEAFSEADPNADAAAALRSMDLDPTWISRRASELSEGQRARVAIARAICALPSGGLLILDESLAGLDRTTERTVLKAITSEQHRSGLACLIVSHQQDFEAHRTLELRDGRWVN